MRATFDKIALDPDVDSSSSDHISETGRATKIDSASTEARKRLEQKGKLNLQSESGKLADEAPSSLRSRMNSEDYTLNENLVSIMNTNQIEPIMSTEMHTDQTRKLETSALEREIMETLGINSPLA